MANLSSSTHLLHLRSDRYLYKQVHVSGCLLFSACLKLTLEIISKVENKLKKNNNKRLRLDNDKLDAHLLYFTMRPLQSSTCFENYMLIIRRLNCIDAASGIVLSVSGRSVHKLRENCSAVLSQLVHRTATD